MNIEDVDAAVRLLAFKWKSLPSKDHDFAQSLLGAYRRGKVSDKQGTCLISLAGRLVTASIPQEYRPEPEPKVEGLRPLIERFDNAVRAGLKFPKIEFGQDGTGLGVSLVLSRAGEKARYPGSINLTDGGRYPDNRWYGRIDRNGTFEITRNGPSGLLDFVRKLAAGTADVAGLYGRATGSCCFCGRELTDPRSVKVGYGPICSERWSLPWGDQ